MAEHVKIQLDVHMNGLDSERHAELNEILIAAENRRKAAREHIRQHEELTHPTKGQSSASG